MALIRCGTGDNSLPTLTMQVYSGSSGSFLCDDLITMGYNTVKCTAVAGGGHAEYKPSPTASTVTMTVNTAYTLESTLWLTSSGANTTCTFELSKA